MRIARVTLGHFKSDYGVGETGEHSLPAITLTVDPRCGFRLQDYLTPAEARELAEKLWMIAEQAEAAS